MGRKGTNHHRVAARSASRKYSIFFYFFIKGLAVDAQDSGGLALVAVRLGKHAHDVFLFDILKGFRGCRRDGVLHREMGWYMVLRDDLGIGQDVDFVNGRFELPDVTRPGVGNQDFGGFG